MDFPNHYYDRKIHYFKRGFYFYTSNSLSSPASSSNAISNVSSKYHPINAGAGLILTDVLGLSGASIVDANILNKFNQGTLIQAGQDVLQAKTLILGL